MICSACFRGARSAKCSTPASRRSSLTGVLGRTFHHRVAALLGRVHSYQPGAPTLISPADLDSRLKESSTSKAGKKLHVLDCTWYLPNANRCALEEFINDGRICGAKFFDLDAIADKSTTLPHMLPGEGAFAAAMDALGISPSDEIVCYDRQGIFSAPRAWWTFLALGHSGRVSVLNGGLPDWQRAFGDDYMIDKDTIERVEVQRPGVACLGHKPGDSVTYGASLRAEVVKSLEDVVATYENATGEIVVDARPVGRWQGVAPEPRKGLPSGHVPMSVNVPWDAVLDSVEVEGKVPYKRFKSENDIRRVLADAGLDARSTDFGDVIASCGSGTTACILVLASEQLQGKTGIMSVYDGSWSEYGASGSRIDTAIE